MFKTFAIHTLGCKVNQYESEQIRKELLEAGLKEVAFKEVADIYFINTCTVTHLADRKSRQMIRRALKLNPEAKVLALGCGVSNQPALKGTDSQVIKISQADKMNFWRYICSDEDFSNYEPRFTLHDSRFTYFPQSRTRALVKVQDGCNRFCSYCIVPLVRGKSRSRPEDEILTEIESLIKAGHQEIVLTGVHLGEYGKDLSCETEAIDLSKLVEIICKKTKINRLRLSSIEPDDFDFKLVDLAEKYPQICQHFHIPLQHASDKILKLMNRPYKLADYKKIIDYISRKLPESAITTDILVGFPKESDKDFEILYDFIKKAPFSRLHIFKYSKRPGTKACEFSSQIPEGIKNKREQLLLSLANQKMVEFENRFLNKEVEVLIEKIKHPEQLLEGYTSNYMHVLVDSIRNVSATGKSTSNQKFLPNRSFKQYSSSLLQQTEFSNGVEGKTHLVGKPIKVILKRQSSRLVGIPNIE